MSLTMQDIKDRLSQQDEVSIMEILHISSKDLVERFEDRIEEQQEELEEELQEDEYD